MFPARALPALEPLASTPGYAVRLHAAAPDRAGQFEEVQVSARASVPLGLKGGCGKKKKHNVEVSGKMGCRLDAMA